MEQPHDVSYIVGRNVTFTGRALGRVQHGDVGMVVAIIRGRPMVRFPERNACWGLDWSMIEYKPTAEEAAAWKLASTTIAQCTGIDVEDPEFYKSKPIHGTVV